MDEHFFDGKVDRSIGTMRLNYYPAPTRLARPGQLRAGTHTHYGGFTILSGDVPGHGNPETLVKSHMTDAKIVRQQNVAAQERAES